MTSTVLRAVTRYVRGLRTNSLQQRRGLNKRAVHHVLLVFSTLQALQALQVLLLVSIVNLLRSTSSFFDHINPTIELRSTLISPAQTIRNLT